MDNRSGIRLLVWGVLLLGCGASASAQMLAGTWIGESEKQIDAVRKTDLRVIVMDEAGRPASGVSVRIEQTRGAFHVGLVLPETGWPDRGVGADTHTEFWRCFNAVSLERLTDWPSLQPRRGSQLDPGRVDLIEKTLAKAEAHNLFVRWGPLISADPGRLPGWAGELSGQALADAVAGYSGLVWRRFGGRIDQYDVSARSLDHGFIQARAGVSVIRRLYESVPVMSPGAQACARFDDGLTLGRFQKMQRRLTAMREAMIPVAAVAIDQRFGGTLERRSLVRQLSRVDQIRGPVVISGLTVGGDSEANAVINLETVLRTLMEHPGIEGIWFSGLTTELAGDPSGALVDQMGLPTPSGRLIDSLFQHLWRTDIDTQADELGNVRVRVFPGAYRVTARLPDGLECVTDVWVEKSADTRVVLLEPLRPGVPVGTVRE
jgi:endo-1,4-beta-xylanase